MKIFLLIAMFFFSTPVYPEVDMKQVQCMAHAVYHEARGEPSAGQVAVAYVVKNRVGHPGFANSICGVVYQPHQFTNIRQTKPNKNSKSWAYAVETSLRVLRGQAKDPTAGRKYFYAQAVVRPRWSAGKKKVIIGRHTFV